MMFKIDIDEDIWTFLKKHAEPFEDTPNSVLKRLLLGENTKIETQDFKQDEKTEFPFFPGGTPQALQQILEVVFLVKKHGSNRIKATHIVAQKHGDIEYQTVIDKYCRQLNKKAYEIDRLLNSDLNEFKSILKNKFINHRDIINEFFEIL